VPPVSVRLTDVTVRRPGERRPAVDSVSLSVPAGARVAVIGPTGAGKSTLLSLVLGLIAPSSGAVELNGRDIGRLSANDLYPRLVSGLTQDAYLFAGSIRANLLLAEPDASQERLWAVLARVGAADWVHGLTLGLDTSIGPDSGLLAGGQRQRVALATTLLADPSVLVLDEPAESLDDAAADLVFDDIVRATRGRTAIVVSHRIRGLRRFDLIVVMVQGKIVQKGTHEDLITRPGFYREQYLAETAH
jgi:ATP-binding cassette subfamily C protein/ATP-binding cassette subfamily C protein CydC